MSLTGHLFSQIPQVVQVHSENEFHKFRDVDQTES
jgi:hypothetical protein